MFIQVIQGKSSRADELRALAESWRDQDGATAVGYLGGTYGVTDGGDFLGIIRFTSREDAMKNSERPETGAFAEKMGALMEGPVEFHDCGDVTEWLDGGSDDAGFVQVIRGHTDNAAPIKEMMTSHSGTLREMRPEIIGGTVAIADDGTFFETVYFTDEESARRGEQVPPPEDVRADLDAMMAGATFYDLSRPWFTSP